MSKPAPASLLRIGNPWRAISNWLSQVPVDDPVDRRNAPMLQIVLLMLATLPPAFWLYRIAATDIPWRPGETVGLLLGLGLAALAAFNVWLIRRGRFRWAVRQLLVGVAIALMLAYAGSGFAANHFEQAIQAVWLIVAGLMVSRRALWLMYAWTVLAFAVGIAVDDRSPRIPDPTMVLVVDGMISAMVFLFVAIVVDRSVTALRESLQAATQRSNALDHANQRLHAEMFERERVQTQLVHAQKVEVVGRLASGVAHDFNHLLGLMLGYAERGRGAIDIETMRGVIEGMELAAKRARAVSQKLLSFSRHDNADPQTFDVREALQDVQPMLRQLFDPSVKVHLALPDQPLPVHVDRGQFDLVILNIAANADQAMPDGGDFNVSVRAADNDDGFVAIELRDTGHGMDDTVRAQAFDPFFTTKPRGQGTGLGLAVARDLVVDAGGDIVIDTEPGRGTAFTIKLPLRRHDQPNTHDATAG